MNEIVHAKFRAFSYIGMDENVKKVRKVNWTKEEYTLIEAIQDAGDILRGTGQCAEINKKKTRLWNNGMRKINSIHGNNRDVKDI